MQPLSGNLRPDLLTHLTHVSLVLRLPREMHLCRSSANVPRLPSFLEMLQNPHVLLTFGNVQNPMRLPRKTTSEPSKVARACGVSNILTWKRASRHSGVHFFDTSTSKSAPKLRCACTFSTSQLPKVLRGCSALCMLTSKCASRYNGVRFFNISTSKPVSFLHFWLRNVLRATTACAFLTCQLPTGVFCTCWLQNVLRATATCNFSTSQLPKVLRTREVFTLLTSTSGPTNHWKNTRCFATFLPFRAPGSSFFWLSLLWSSFCFSSLLWLFPSLLFICPCCRKFDF